MRNAIQKDRTPSSPPHAMVLVAKTSRIHCFSPQKILQKLLTMLQEGHPSNPLLGITHLEPFQTSMQMPPTFLSLSCAWKGFLGSQDLSKMQRGIHWGGTPGFDLHWRT